MCNRLSEHLRDLYYTKKGKTVSLPPLPRHLKNLISQTVNEHIISLFPSLYGYPIIYLYMKHLIIIVCLHCFFCSLTAQVVNQDRPKRADAEVLSFSTNLVEGAIVFTKTFRKNYPSDPIYAAHYTITNVLHNSGKPVEVALNKQGFDTYFTATPLLSASRPRLLAYAEAMKLSFTEEKGWTVLMNYYNMSFIK